MSSTNLSLGDLVAGAATDAGRTGKNNEDSFDLFEVDWQDGERLRRVQVILVCDGIGGNNAGEVASKIAVETIRLAIADDPTAPLPQRMERAVQLASQAVYSRALENPALRGMGTTVVMAAIVESTLYVVHAGDSRAYLIRNGAAYRLTLDHTWAQEAIDHGVLTPEAARVHPNRNVIRRFLGVDEKVEVDSGIVALDQPPNGTEGPGKWSLVDRLPLQPGDTVLLCSDGLTDEISDEELQTAVRRYAPQEAAEQLTALANDHGGRDNITVALLRLPGAASAALAAPMAVAQPKSGRRLGLIAGLAAVLLLLVLALFFVLRPEAMDQPAAPSPAVAVANTLPAALASPEATATTARETLLPTGTPEAMAVTAEASIHLTMTQVVSGPAALLTASGTAPPGGATTSTPIPTHTPTATATATATRVAPTPTVTAARASASPTTTSLPAGIRVNLIEPEDGDGSGSVQRFRWQPAAGTLAANQAYELRFWKPDADALADGFGPAGATTGLEQLISLPAVDANAALPFSPGEYLWGVVLVQQDPYVALRLISPARRFVYQATPDCVGAGCQRP